MNEQHRKDNLRWWNEVTPVHVKSYGTHFVGVEEFLSGRTALDPLEIDEIGPVSGKSLLHLQCHFGLDTLSWAREGATVTGIDFSEEAIQTAQKLAERAALTAHFIQSDLYELPFNLDGQFDVVYTSRGVLNWLDNIERWAEIIRHFLKPGGIFYLMEIHPFLFTLDLDEKGRPAIVEPYFHSNEPLLCESGDPDYADETFYPKSQTWEWGWSLGDVINALVKAGLRIEFLHELPWSFYKALPNMEEVETGRWTLPGFEGKLPLTYSLRAVAG